ncbi:hypothetical protein PR048_029910 [Dryococelus australis]|uniref:Uncharacterized protein n=1 Tax=Dryococelus australis TaxID=614101 RepID=A0ABQ9GBD3_9NEOP|nr:hypothetical protein PR048_029910 [Dryococelus australis]
MHSDQRISRTVYQQVFRNDFLTLQFGTRRSATWKYCDMLYHKLIAADNDTDAAKVKLESELHHVRAEQTNYALKWDTVFADERKSHDNMFRFTAGLVLPYTYTLQYVLQRQLSCYNFAIHEAWINSFTMNIWKETVGK